MSKPSVETKKVAVRSMSPVTNWGIAGLSIALDKENVAP